MQIKEYVHITVREREPGLFVLMVGPSNTGSPLEEIDEAASLELAKFKNARDAYDWIEKNQTRFPLDDNWHLVMLERLVSGTSGNTRFTFIMELVTPDKENFEIDNPLNCPRLVAFLVNTENSDSLHIWTYGQSYGVREFPPMSGKKVWNKVFSDKLSFDDLYDIFEL